MRIYLIGYMGSGKTTVGRKIASNTDLEFHDLDMMIEEKFKISLPDLFKKYDEHAFRKLEQKVLHLSAKLTNAVISTGGGSPCFFDNMDFIKKNGLSVYVKMSPQSLHYRLMRSKRNRPILDGIPVENLKEHIEKQLAEREKFYSRADLIVRGESIDIKELSESILANLVQE